MRNSITEEELAEARKLREQGHGWHTIGRMIGRDGDGLRRHFDEEYRQKRNVAAAKAMKDIHARNGRPKVERTMPMKPVPKLQDDYIAHVPPRAGATAPSSLSLGDPPPGRSALDRRNAIDRGSKEAPERGD